MINFSYFQPRILPVLGTSDSAEIDRAQSIDPTSTLNREKVEEIGRDGVVGYLKKSPTIAYRLSQLEYGSIEFWNKLINSDAKGGVSEDPITLNDFKTPYFDICAYLTDDDGTFRGTIWYPALRTSGFSLNIGDPQARIERSFDFVGESSVIWQGANKYLIFDKHEVESGEADTNDDVTIDLSGSATPTPAEDPDNPGTYMLRVVRVRGTTSTVLTVVTDYDYETAGSLVVHNCVTGDVIKYWYTSADAPATIFTPNNVDASGILGDCASIYLYVPATGKPSASDYLYRLQSLNLEVAFDREDLREIGNKNVVQRGVKTKTVTATLGRILEQFTIEEVLRGEVADYGKLDVEKFVDTVALIVKIYSDNTKTTFKYGFLATGMTPTEIRGGATVGEYTNGETTMEGETLIISADATEIGV